MSLLFDGDSGRVDIGGSGPTFAECSIVGWFKFADHSARKGLVGITALTTDDDGPWIYLRDVDSYSSGYARSGGPTNQDVVNDNNELSSSAWQFLVYRHSDSGDLQKMRRNGGTDKSGTFSSAYPNGTSPRYISMGRWTVADDANYLTNVHRAAHVAIYDRYLSDAECTFLWNGGTAGAGGNPMAVSGLDPIAYWKGDSLTDQVGSFTLASIDGTVTVDGADNPTVDDPPAAASGVPKTTKLTLLGVG